MMIAGRERGREREAWAGAWKRGVSEKGFSDVSVDDSTVCVLGMYCWMCVRKWVEEEEEGEEGKR